MPGFGFEERTPFLRLRYETNELRNDNWVRLDDILGSAYTPGSPIQLPPNVVLPPTGVIPGLYGDAAHTVTLTVDAAGRIFALLNVAILIGDANITGLAYTKLTGAPTIPTTLPPSGPAGGDLAGSTYPNPVIAGSAVTRAKLAPNAPCGTPVTTTLPTSQTWSGPLAFTTIGSVVVPTRGGSVLLIAAPALSAVATPAGGTNVSLRWLRDGTQLVSTSYLINTDTHHDALGTLTWIDPAPAAGTHTYAFQLAIDLAGGTVLSSNLTGGSIMGMEVG